MYQYEDIYMNVIMCVNVNKTRGQLIYNDEHFFVHFFFGSFSRFADTANIKNDQQYANVTVTSHINVSVFIKHPNKILSLEKNKFLTQKGRYYRKI